METEHLRGSTNEAAAWAAHEVLIQRLVAEGLLTPETAINLCTEENKEEWLRLYRGEDVRL